MGTSAKIRPDLFSANQFLESLGYDVSQAYVLEPRKIMEEAYQGITHRPQKAPVIILSLCKVLSSGNHQPNETVYALGAESQTWNGDIFDSSLKQETIQAHAHHLPTPNVPEEIEGKGKKRD